MVQALNIDLNFRTPSQKKLAPRDYPPPSRCESFITALKNVDIVWTDDGEDRLCRAHGHTLAEMNILRTGKFDRIPGMKLRLIAWFVKFCSSGEDQSSNQSIDRLSNECIHLIQSTNQSTHNDGRKLFEFFLFFPDLVVFPKSHDDVVTLVNLANEHNVAIIPFGGGTSVSQALMCLAHEVRMIVSLDTSQMNKILWIDEKNWTACIQAGKVGQDLEAELAKQGFCTGTLCIFNVERFSVSMFVCLIVWLIDWLIIKQCFLVSWFFCRTWAGLDGIQYSGRMGCHTSVGHEEERLRKHWRLGGAHKNGHGPRSHPKKLPSPSYVGGAGHSPVHFGIRRNTRRRNGSRHENSTTARGEAVWVHRLPQLRRGCRLSASSSKRTMLVSNFNSIKVDALTSFLDDPLFHFFVHFTIKFYFFSELIKLN